MWTLTDFFLENCELLGVSGNFLIELYLHILELLSTCCQSFVPHLNLRYPLLRLNFWAPVEILVLESFVLLRHKRLALKSKKLNLFCGNCGGFNLEILWSWQPQFFGIFSLSGGVSGKLIRDPWSTNEAASNDPNKSFVPQCRVANFTHLFSSVNSTKLMNFSRGTQPIFSF